MNDRLQLATSLSDEIDPAEDRFERLEREMEELREQFAAVRNEIKREAVVALLGLLTSAMREVASGKYDLSSIRTDGASTSAWDAVKQRLAPRLREAVDILLVQGSMFRTQLAAAMKMDYSNCNKNVITVLIRQGLVVENGRELALKELR